MHPGVYKSLLRAFEDAYKPKCACIHFSISIVPLQIKPLLICLDLSIILYS